MKKVKFSFILLGLTAIITILLIYGKTLIKPHITDKLTPIFSVSAGFYDNPFELTISSCSGAQIFYTLDGSDPLKTGQLYDGPIQITDRANEPNIYSAHEDFSTSNMVEDYRFNPPEEPVDKICVVKAVAIKNDHTSEIVTNSYIVGWDNDKYSNEFKVVSLVADPTDLFDYENGIYVTGKKTQEYCDAHEGIYDEDLGVWYRDGNTWRRWDANYYQEGLDWERPAHIEIFDSNKDSISSQNIGIRIKGGASRSFAQKSLNLYARSEYDTDNYFPAGIVDNIRHKRLTLFAGGNDYETMIRDILVQRLSEGLNFSNMHMYPCYLFLDGEFWGVYYLTEHYSDEYVEENYGVPKSEIQYISDNGVEGDESFLKYLENCDVENPSDYQKLLNSIDIDGFIDYYAVLVYIARCKDWPNLNESIWRSTSISNRPYMDSKYRWMLYDLNWNSSCMTEELIDFNSYEYLEEESLLFRKLASNYDFRLKFANRLKEIASDRFNENEINKNFDYLVNLMRDSVKMNLYRYYGSYKTVEDFDSEVQDMRDFFSKRFDVLMTMTDDWVNKDM